MFKLYRKFCQKHAGKDPLQAMEREYRRSKGLEEDEAMQLPDSQEAEDLKPEDEASNAEMVGPSKLRKRAVSKEDVVDYTAKVQVVGDAMTCLVPIEEQKSVLYRLENDLSHTWNLETLQLVRLFDRELDEKDPFYIPGQQTKQAVKPTNPYQKKSFQDNFIDSEAIDDPDAIDALHNKAAIDQAPPKTLYRKLHEIKPQYRLAILLWLCQNKLDTETPEFMAEITRIAKPPQTATIAKDKKKKPTNEESEGDESKLIKLAEQERVEKVLY